MFDDSINLVIWGHEHDCRIVPEDVAGKKYRITQPGSSVATSLTEGESIQKCVLTTRSVSHHPADPFQRHVALVRVQGTRYDLTPIPLRSVRPFLADDLDLAEAAEEENVDLSDTLAVMKFIRTKVCSSILRIGDAIWPNPLVHRLRFRSLRSRSNGLSG